MKREPEQLHIASVSRGEYEIEDILKEFGSAEAEPKQTSSDTIKFQPIKTEQLEASAQEPVKIVQSVKQVQVKPLRTSAAPIKICEPVEEAPPQEDLKSLRLRIYSMRTRRLLLVALMLVGLFITLCEGNRWDLPFLLEAPWLRVTLFGAAVLCAYDVLWSGLRDLLRLRISLYTLCLTSVILCLIYSLYYADADFAPLVTIQLLFHQSALLYEKRAFYHTKKTIDSFSAPMGVCDAPQLLENAASLRRDKGNAADFWSKFGKSSVPNDILRVYATILLPLLPGLSYLLAQFSGMPFVKVWLLLLLGAVPCAGMLSFHLPFSSVAKRLAGYGGALCGWHGAQIFSGKHTIILRDGDLFPKRNITSNGMKIYGNYDAAKLISYALAGLKLAQSPLVDLFEQLLQQQFGRPSRAREYRCYNHGGIGMEIGNDIVLVGSLDFVRSMGVDMPAGTRVKQAVYVSVNGELAGVFAVKYKPSSSTKTGLHDVLTNRNFSVVFATRDFLITPELIAAKYDLSTETMVFPDYNERLRLSETNAEQAMSQGALIAEDTFGAFAVTVAAGRTLRSTSFLTLAMSLAAGILGLLVCILLIAWEAVAVASPLHIAAFRLLWAAVSIIVTYIFLKF